MSVFTFISRRPRVIGRPKHIVTPPAQPVKFVYRARRWPVKIKHGSSIRLLRVRRLRYPQPIVAPAGFVAVRKAWPRVKIKRWRRLVRPPRRFQPQAAPVGFIYRARHWSIRIKRGRRLTRWAARRFAPQAATVGFIPTKRKWPVKVKRARKLVRWFSIRRFQPHQAPVGFVPTKHRWPVKIKHARRLTRAARKFQPQDATAGFVPTKRRWPVRIRHAKTSVLWFAKRRFQPQRATAGFVPQKRMLRPKIKRARIRLRHSFTLLSAAAVLFRRLPRLKIRRARSSALWLGRRRLQPQKAPAGFIPTKRKWPVKVRRKRRFTRRIFPILPQATLLFRKLTRPKIKRARTITLWFARKRLRLQPQARSAGFVPAKHRWPQVKIRRARKLVRWFAIRRLQPLRGPVGFIPVRRRRPIKIKRARHFIRRTYPTLPQLLVLFRKFARLKIRRGKASALWFARRRLQPMDPPVGFVPTKHRWQIRIRRARRFAGQIYAFTIPPLPPFPILLNRIVNMMPFHYPSLGYEEITDLTSAVGLGAIPGGAGVAFISISGGDVSWRDDGIAPTPSDATQMLDGTKLKYSGNLHAIQFIRVRGSPVLDVYYRSGSLTLSDTFYKDVGID